MRRTLAFHPLLAWALAAAITVVGATALNSWASRAEARRHAWGADVEVVVVVAPVIAGDAIDVTDVEVRTLPEGVVPPGALEALPVGRVAMVDLHVGEVLLGERVAPDGVRGAAALVGEGRRAMAVPRGLEGIEVDIGDHVDVLVAFAASASDSDDDPALVVAEDAIVVAVSDDAVTVAIDAFDAPRLAFALANGAVTLALRPPGG